MAEKKSGGSLKNNDLSIFFEPKNLAIIGSFRENYFGGHVVVKSLLEGGFHGGIFPVNSNARETHGLRVYPSLKEVPAKIDLVLVMINARRVPRVIQECGEMGIKGIVVVSDGFAERDLEGRRLQEEILKIAGQWGIRLLGPNTAGILNTSCGLNPAPYEAGYYRVKKGPVAILAQTGMINPQAVPYPDLRFGISKVCDFGNKCDLDECDVMAYLAEDEETGVITMYLESIRDGRRFIETCRQVSARKPVLVLKGGKTREGARASVSHTGSLAVDDAVFNAACRQSGLLRVERFAELFEMPKIFAGQPLPRGNRLGILSITGGVAVLCIDRASTYGLQLAELSRETAVRLDRWFPGAGKMPVDIGPMMAAVRDAFSLYPELLREVLEDEGVDCLLNILWANPRGGIIERYLEAYEGVKDGLRKPLVTWVYGPDSAIVQETAFRLEDMGFPVFREPEICIKALGLALRYAEWRKGA